jgi:excisionase family DNA binding protein
MALKSIQQAANTWGVSVYTVRRLATAGLVRTVRVGRRRLVSENEIERVVAAGVPRAVVPDNAGQRK